MVVWMYIGSVDNEYNGEKLYYIKEHWDIFNSIRWSHTDEKYEMAKPL